MTDDFPPDENPRPARETEPAEPSRDQTAETVGRDRRSRRAKPPSQTDYAHAKPQSAETEPAPALTDPSPKRKPGRPKGSKDRKPRFNARRAAQQLERAANRPKRYLGNLLGSVSVEFRQAGALDRLDAYVEACGFEGRAGAARELILSGLARWEALSRQQAPSARPEPILSLRDRVRVAWSVLCHGTVPTRP